MKKIACIAPIVLMILMSFNKKVDRDTYPFEVVKSGTGKQSIIFIPGFACSGKVWDETKLRYEKDYTCYTLTMAGFAGVTPAPDVNFKSWETGIADYIKDKHIENPLIVGHSMGGALALALAADYPELISKIVVVDALPCLQAIANPTFKSLEKPDCSAMEKQVINLTSDQFYKMQKVSIPMLLADTSKQELVISWSLQSDRKTFAEMYCDFYNTDLRDKIKTIKCPSLILLEANFQHVKQVIEEQYKNLKNADLQYANKGLHFIMYDDKEWYFSQLNKFIPTK